MDFLNPQIFRNFDIPAIRYSFIFIIQYKTYSGGFHSILIVYMGTLGDQLHVNSA